MAEISRKKMTSTQKVIAKNLLHGSVDFAHSWGWQEFRADNLLAFKKEFKDKGIRMSYTSIFCKAIGIALAKNLELNARLEGEELVFYDDVNIGIGVDTPRGLLMVVAKQCDKKSLLQISDEINTLIDKAKSGKLTMDDCTGSTVSISNMTGSNFCGGYSVLYNDECLMINFTKVQERAVRGENDQVEWANYILSGCTLNHAISSGVPQDKFLIDLMEVLGDPKKYMAE